MSRVLPGGHRLRRCQSCGAEAWTLEDCACRECPSIVGRAEDGTVTYRRPGTRLTLVDLPAQSQTEKRVGRVSCGRSGCRNAAAVTLPNGELCCLRCLAELGNGNGDGDAEGPQAEARGPSHAEGPKA